MSAARDPNDHLTGPQRDVAARGQDPAAAHHNGEAPSNGHAAPGYDPTHGGVPLGHDLGFALPEPAKVSKTRLIAIAGIIAAVLGTAFVLSWIPRRVAKHELEADTAAATVSKPRVQVIAPKTTKTDRALTLPGSIMALEETVIFPRASGYVHAWRVDLGDKVKEGDLLAEIDTPELDQQLAQARAQLAQTEANIVLAKANATFSAKNYARYQELVKQGIASQEDLEKQKAQADVDAANVTVANANTQAQRANIARIVDLKSFGRVVAPFSGTITLRSIERGTLVSEGTATPLFKLTAMDPVRVIIQIPQAFAPSIKVGTVAKMTVKEFGNRAFDGTVARSAGALDASTRTMTTEVRVPNPNGDLLTGMYAQIAFDLATPHVIYEVPGTALITDARGVHVATVTPDNRVHMTPVVVERDTGATIEINSGLEGNERIIKLPAAELVEGTPVEVTQ